MEIAQGLLNGFASALTPGNLLLAFAGALWGTLVGVLPGIGPVGGIALLLPFTYAMKDATGALILMAGIYYGAMYGGSTTSILLNVPGEAASVVTCLDGYQMARQGRAGPALAIAAIGSYVAGTAGVVGLMLLAQALVPVALRFGPPEFFALTVLGLAMVAYLSGDSILKGLLMGTLGLMLGTVGMDPVGGVARYDYGRPELLGGIEIPAAAIGLFAIAEVLVSAEEGTAQGVVQSGYRRLRDLWPSARDFRDSAGAMGRGTVLGFLVGILPGGSAVVASFIAYGIEKQLSRHPERFGKGAIEGVASAESANNAAACGAMVPLLTLGMPYSLVAALMLNAMIVHGVTPSPLLMQQQPALFWTLVASMYLGNLMLLILNLPLVGLWASLLRIPYHYLLALIVVFTVVGTYSVNNSMFDVAVMLGMGVLGYLLRKAEYPLAPIVLAMVLGPLMENALRQSLIISQGSLGIFVSRPGAAALLAVAFLAVFAPLLRPRGRLPAAGDV